jgi:pyruvate/2-oxoglutarate dehydrogenase complex dihydrolipoamide dehydrogenase (E3) component
MYNTNVISSKRILIIGGGPAGIQAALAAAGAGCNVTLISDSPPGGRAAWNTLLPSKIWLEAKAPVDLARLRTRYEQVAGTWQRQLLNDLERAGVELRLGTASFMSPHEVQVTPPEGGYPDQFSADVVILATGAVPFLPPGLQPDGECIFSPHLVWQIKTLPESMIVIGAGGPATEYVDAFSRLGVKVTWITGPVAALSAFPSDAGRFITALMERRGVHITAGMLARQIERTANGIQVQTANGGIHEAETAFVAIGLRPDFERLNLPAAGLKIGSSGGLMTDAYGRTAQPHIYLVGDAASPLSANISIAQGQSAGWHAAGLPVEPIRTDLAVMAIYTQPQVAMVGRIADRTGVLQKVRVPFNACLRAHLLDPSGADLSTYLENGFVEITYDPARRIAGALAVCPEAAEILTPLAVAIRGEMTLETLASVYAAHPTFTELAILAARMAR